VSTKGAPHDGQNTAKIEGMEVEKKRKKHKDFLVPGPKKFQPGPDG